MKVLDPETVESSELVEQTFQFWFNDNGHIRSPFPNYIQGELKQLASKRFFEWTSNLKENAKDEMNDEMIGEKFEEIIFDIATGMVKTEDEKITILYPFLPRLQDEIKDAEGKDCTVIDRNIIKLKDNSFLEVMLKGEDDKEWKTSFELPL